jgi:hypothetical protein
MRTGGKNILRHHALGQRFDPLILRAETLVEVNSNASPNNNALINPTGEPWEIHEIKFGVRRETDLSVMRVSGAMLDVNIGWCGKPVTDGFVPVWNCGAQQAVEEFRALQAASIADLGGYWKAQDCFYTWKLDHPLYVPPRRALSVEFRNNGLVNSPTRASVALIGRVMPRSARPIKVKVPYVSAWKSGFYPYLESGDPETSPESVLFNQFQTPLTVERFVGRMVQRVQTLETTESFVYVDQVSRLAFRGSLFSAKHRMTDGSIVARDWSKFGNLYGWRNYKWNVRHVLESDVGHVIELRKNAPTEGAGPFAATLATDIISATAQASVSLVGWREEEVP